ncbi:Predicted periplasmic or secreted lipoprotein [Variovorax sp. HW608]|uniref:BON domain-containing protein n=1 Tax=Variovorax sp. HW608 TaxID=1034889 RepID=UPI00081FA54E|nr:BON domain-containing protein [Variovorax sp. HW608]SCK57479.1 Predicted periplasmic or secreted lipoprotein [Variovorax sp. HW608]
MFSKDCIRTPPLLRIAVIAASCILGAAACTDRAADESTKRQVDAAVDQVGKTASAAADKATELAEIARDKTKAFVTSPEVKQDAVAAKEAIKHLGEATVASTDDAGVTLAVSAALARDPDLTVSRIDVEARNGAVRLTGPAPSEEAKARAGEIAKSVKGVVSVDNALEVRSTG